MDIKELVLKKAEAANRTAKVLATLNTEVKNKALLAMAKGLEENSEKIILENSKDVALAKEKGLPPAFIDRLILNPSRIKSMAEGLREVASLPDPVGEIIKMWKRPNGLQIGKVRVPLGVIGFIYESRPNVTVDAAGLALKSGNAIILRGGSEAINSNIILTQILREACGNSGVPENALQIMEVIDRRAILELIKLDQYIDLLIPRGGKELIEMIGEHSKIPVIYHYKGNCHVYVDKEANLKMAEEIAFNAKVQRPGVCNALETLLVHRDIAEEFLLPMIRRYEEAGVEIRGCPEVRRIVPNIKEATEEDWWTEYLDLILAVKVVRDLDEAIEHINHYGSKLSDAIVTSNYFHAQRFLREVDSAVVYVNASTRFTDGNQFGLGAEIGISTQKLHARGPMGLEELTTIKYIVFGEGQIRT